MTLRLLADDLTGALDTAAAFCGARGPVGVFLSPPATAGDAVLDLACRDGAEADAVAATLAAAPLLDGAGIAYLKIDSLLRGHWAAMLAALWRRGAFRSCVFAPAFPSQGRVTRLGRQFVRDSTGTLQPISLDPEAALAAQGVTGVSLCNAGSDEDLRAIVAEARSLPGPVLWCGSAGLAAALAGAPVPHVDWLPGPALAVIGSCHPVSAMQIRHWGETAGQSPLKLRGVPADIENVAGEMGQRGRCLVQVDILPFSAPADAATRIAAGLRATLPLLAPPGTLIAAGGQTLRAACEALGVTRLDVEGAFAPGIPVARLRDGAWDGVRLVSKSGAFGTPDLLARLFAAVKDFDGK